MLENIIRSWRTSGPALVMALAGIFLIFIPDQGALINQVAEGVIVLCGVLIGIFAKDSGVTGTALNPRAEIAGEPTPPLSPSAAETKAVIISKK